MTSRVPSGPSVDNVDARLRAFWHPVGLTSDPPPRTVRLLGDDIDVGGSGTLTEHLGLWWFAPEAPIAPLPTVPEHDDPRFVAVHSPPEDWSAGAGQLADNFLDIGHIPWLHRESFAGPEVETIGRMDLERDATGFSAGYRHRTQRLHGDGTGGRVMTIWYTAPFAVMMRLEYLDDDATITAAFFVQPLDADSTRLYAVNWRDDILDGRCTRERTIAFQRQVGAEDRRMLERLPHRWTPLDTRAEVHTRADATTLEMRRTLARLLGEGAVPAT